MWGWTCRQHLPVSLCPLSLPPTPPLLLIRLMVIDKPVTDTAERAHGPRTWAVLWARSCVFDLFSCFVRLVVYFAQLSPGLLNFSRENQNHMGSIHLHKPKFLPVRKNVCLVNSYFFSEKIITAQKKSNKTHLWLTKYLSVPEI